MTPIEVLYFEDDPISAQILGFGLRKLDIHVLHVPDTLPDTLKKLETPRYQQARAVLIDHYLSGMQGTDLARLLRQQGDQRPFFLVTAGQRPAPELLQELNITYLPKPIDFKHVAELIRARITATTQG